MGRVIQARRAFKRQFEGQSDLTYRIEEIGEAGGCYVLRVSSLSIPKLPHLRIACPIPKTDCEEDIEPGMSLKFENTSAEGASVIFNGNMSEKVSLVRSIRVWKPEYINNHPRALRRFRKQ